MGSDSNVPPSTPAACAAHHAYCPWCECWRGHSSDCGLSNIENDPDSRCDCVLSQAPADPIAMASALRAIIALCPAEDPGPARDMWGYVSNGNQEDVARDCVNEALWRVRQLALKGLPADGPKGQALADRGPPSAP